MARMMHEERTRKDDQEKPRETLERRLQGP